MTLFNVYTTETNKLVFTNKTEKEVLDFFNEVTKKTGYPAELLYKYVAIEDDKSVKE